MTPLLQTSTNKPLPLISKSLLIVNEGSFASDLPPTDINEALNTIPFAEWNGRLIQVIKEKDPFNAIADAIFPFSPDRSQKKVQTGPNGTEQSSPCSKELSESYVKRLERLTDHNHCRGVVQTCTFLTTAFLNHSLFVASLQKVLEKNRFESYHIFERLKDMIDALNGENILKIARYLVQSDHPAVLDFLHTCKNHPCFVKIATEVIPDNILEHYVNESAFNKRDIEGVIQVLKVRKDMIPVFLPHTLSRTYDPSEYSQIGKEIGEEELFERYARAKSCVFPEPIRYFVNSYDKQELERLQQALSFDLPMTRKTLRSCLATPHYSGIELLLSRMGDAHIRECRKDILAVISRLKDPILAEIALARDPELVKEIPFNRLLRSVRKGNFWFVEWATNNGCRIDPEVGRRLLPHAAHSGNIPLMKLLSKFCSSPSDGLSCTFPDVLGLEKVQAAGDMVHHLQHFAMFSPLEEIYGLVARYPEYAHALQNVTDGLGLLVRFPSVSLASSIGYRNSSLSAYVKRSGHYAAMNTKLVSDLVPILKTVGRSELLQRIMEDRYSRFPDKNSRESQEYKLLRGSTLKSSWTHLYVTNASDVGSRSEGYNYIQSIMPERYTWCLQHLIKMCYDKKDRQWIKPPYDSVDSSEDYSGFLFNYHYTGTDENGNKIKLRTTSVTPIKMDHTPVATINKLRTTLDAFHREIVDYDLNIADRASLKGFYERVARAYWLFATLCESHRGTPHNAMIWLNLIYAHHRLPPPIPKMEHYFLDNTMLVTPIEKVIDEWESYFEPPLDIALDEIHGGDSNAILADLLERNGMLLRLCSPNVRNNPTLTKIAIRSNRDAWQFASREVRN